jgi:hypothetical protein
MRVPCFFLVLFVALAPSVAVLAQAPESARTMVVVTGAPGTDKFGESFGQWAGRWESAATAAGFTVQRIEPSPDDQVSRERLHSAVLEIVADNPGEAWIVLIGHGTFDGNTARFNLAGPDVSAAEMASWLKPRTQLTVIVNCAASSAPFAAALAGEQRVIVTATRSGFESGFARFGEYLSEALTDPTLDLDKDDQVSLLEMFVAAASRTATFYETEGRLATEHAMIEDNGDGLGTPADWFRGTRVVVRPQEDQAVDGMLANRVFLAPGEAEQQLSAAQRVERDRLEAEIEALRQRKPELGDNEYYEQLEAILLRLARLYFPEGPPDD